MAILLGSKTKASQPRPPYVFFIEIKVTFSLFLFSCSNAMSFALNYVPIYTVSGTHGATTLRIMTFGFTTLSITTLSITIHYVILSITTQHNNKHASLSITKLSVMLLLLDVMFYCYAGCHLNWVYFIDVQRSAMLGITLYCYTEYHLCWASHFILMLSIIIPNVFYARCFILLLFSVKYAECRYAECRGAVRMALK
jgi:hypothetical protein